MSRLRAVILSLAGLGVVLLVVGCGVPAEDDARRASPDEVPEELLRPSTTVPPTTTTVAAPFDVTLYFADADSRLVEVERSLETSPSLEDLVRLLLDEPVASEDAGPLRTALAGGADPVVRSVSLDRGVAVVDLSGAFRGLPSGDQILGVAQIVYTVTGRSGVGRASFTLEGQPVEVPIGDGSLTGEPVARDDYANLLADE